MAPKTRDELAYAYMFSNTSTFSKHLKRHGIQLIPRCLITAEKQLEIYDKMGIPLGFSATERAEITPLLKAYREERNRDDE